ncbi:MAG: hypothetical protein QOH63_1835 [Acidobacteriota bacterium]|jgi:hypothetical protein|nr:hypothetical protein [Acidobacteriota bacterium]
MFGGFARGEALVKSRNGLARCGKFPDTCLA